MFGDVAIIEVIKWVVPAFLTAAVATLAAKRGEISRWRAEMRERANLMSAWLEYVPQWRDDMKTLKDSDSWITSQNRALDARIGKIEVVLGELSARTLSEFESSPVARFECDSAGRNSSVNAAFAELLGCERDDLADLRWRSFILPSELPDYIDRQSAAVVDHRKFDDEVTMKRRNGTTVRVRVMMLPFPPDAGPATHWSGIVMEVR